MTPGRLSPRSEFTPVPSHGSIFVYMIPLPLSNIGKPSCSQIPRDHPAHLIGCDKKSEIVRYFQGKLTLFYHMQVSEEKNHFNVV